MAQGIIFGQATGGLTSIVKSVQYGSILLAADSQVTNTATITSVVLANSIVMSMGKKIDFVGTSSRYNTTEFNITLTNATTVTLARSADTDTNLTAQFVVIEYEEGVLTSNQSGSIHLEGDSQVTNTATITSVDTDKAMLIDRGSAVGGANNDDFSEMEQSVGNITLTNATTVTAERHSQGTASNDDLDKYFTIIEFI